MFFYLGAGDDNATAGVGLQYEVSIKSVQAEVTASEIDPWSGDGVHSALCEAIEQVRKMLFFLADIELSGLDNRNDEHPVLPGVL